MLRLASRRSLAALQAARPFVSSSPLAGWQGEGADAQQRRQAAAPAAGQLVPSPRPSRLELFLSPLTLALRRCASLRACSRAGERLRRHTPLSFAAHLRAGYWRRSRCAARAARSCLCARSWRRRRGWTPLR